MNNLSTSSLYLIAHTCLFFLQQGNIRNIFGRDGGSSPGVTGSGNYFFYDRYLKQTNMDNPVSTKVSFNVQVFV